jgi:hypothetical protein
MLLVDKMIYCKDVQCLKTRGHPEIQICCLWNIAFTRTGRLIAMWNRWPIASTWARLISEAPQEKNACKALKMISVIITLTIWKLPLWKWFTRFMQVFHRLHFHFHLNFITYICIVISFQKF